MKEMEVIRTTEDEELVNSLYHRLLEYWNKRNASGFADLFSEDGYTIGFDGSEAKGKQVIQQHLSAIFAHHPTAKYVSLVRKIYPIEPSVWVVRADVGMIQPGQQEINPALNAIQTLVVAKTNNEFKIALLQNTPAAFHGRPEAIEKLTNELRHIYGKS